MAKLDPYRAKRDFSSTEEPRGGRTRRAEAASRAFVVHKHAARRLHYDLRLEHDGVLWSWAVTRGPSLDPDDKRLAVHVEDHPLDYRSFEGTIPKGQYGAGAVIVWDEGRWEPEGDPKKSMAKGHLSFQLHGRKLEGGWHLVRLKARAGEKRDNWLLIKAKDGAASHDDILERSPASVRTGRTVEEVSAGQGAPAGGSAAKSKVKGPSGRTSRRASAPPPAFVAPCLAQLRETPASSEKWVHEIKFDGYRIQARIDDRAVRLLTRTGLDWSKRFGQNIRDALLRLPCQSALIDGEIVVIDDAGVSSFSALQAALSTGRHSRFVAYVFDLLFLDGEDLRTEPLLARKEQLAQLLAKADPAFLRFSEHFSEPGQMMIDHVCRMGLEGVISKRIDAPYRSGRTGDWLKSKCTQSQEFVIAGYVPSDKRSGGLRSLVAAYYEDGALRPAGRVGTGFTEKSAAAVKKGLDALRTPASGFVGKAGREKGIVWVKPERVAEVEFRGWTGDGLLRQASFKGLREDKPATEVVVEKPVRSDDEDDRRVRQAGTKTVGKPVRPEGTDGGERGKTKRRSAPAPVTNIKLTNPDKVLWPDATVTKSGLLNHYASVWRLMQPYITRRPLSLLRAPDGVGKQTFFQKHASPGINPAIRTLKDPKDGEDLLFIEDFDGLAALVQLGVVEIHVWGATVDRIEKPDQVIFDLDPDESVGADATAAAALEVRNRLADLGFRSFAKLSGGKGYHVTVPLKPAAEWAAVKSFAGDFARALAQMQPDRYTATLARKARKGRIFIDYLRNGRGATAIAPYSTRARPGATVAAPVSWQNVENGMPPDHFRVGSALPDGNAWASFFGAAKVLPSVKTSG